LIIVKLGVGYIWEKNKL